MIYVKANNLPCDTGSVRLFLSLLCTRVSSLSLLEQPRDVLEGTPEYAGLDFSELTPDWLSKAGFYSSTVAALQQRARWVRQWLRARPEREIVVVAHGDILRYITEGYNSHAPWANAEVREFTFEVDEEEDGRGEAWLVPIQKVAKKGLNEPTSSEVAPIQRLYN